jgi:hypothetical protein
LLLITRAFQSNHNSVPDQLIVAHTGYGRNVADEHLPGFLAAHGALFAKHRKHQQAQAGPHQKQTRPSHRAEPRII